MLLNLADASTQKKSERERKRKNFLKCVNLLTEDINLISWKTVN